MKQWHRFAFGAACLAGAAATIAIGFQLASISPVDRQQSLSPASSGKNVPFPPERNLAGTNRPLANIGGQSLRLDVGAPWLRTLAALEAEKAPADVTAGRMAAMLPSLPPEGQLECARRIVALSSDESYSAAETVYFAPATSEPVRRLIFEDLMGRRNELKLPLLLRTLRTPAHSMREDAISALQLFVGRDVGNEPGKWDAAVQEAIATRNLDRASASTPAP